MRARKTYDPKDFRSPVSLAVHRQPEGTYWYNTRREDFTPPIPRKELRKGFPRWEIEHQGRVLFFASREEVVHAIDVLGQRVLPRPQDLQGDGSFGGKHWISRIHKSWTPWKVRQRLVRKLAELL